MRHYTLPHILQAVMRSCEKILLQIHIKVYMSVDSATFVDGTSPVFSSTVYASLRLYKISNGQDSKLNLHNVKLFFWRLEHLPLILRLLLVYSTLVGTRSKTSRRTRYQSMCRHFLELAFDLMAFVKKLHSEDSRC